MTRWHRRSTNGAAAESGGKVERRDMTPLGVARRERFEESLDRLRALGLSPVAVEHYRRPARTTHKLPHQLVCAMAEHTADDAALMARIVSGGGPA